MIFIYYKTQYLPLVLFFKQQRDIGGWYLWYGYWYLLTIKDEYCWELDNNLLLHQYHSSEVMAAAIGQEFFEFVKHRPFSSGSSPVSTSKNIN